MNKKRPILIVGYPHVLVAVLIRDRIAPFFPKHKIICAHHSEGHCHTRETFFNLIILCLETAATSIRFVETVRIADHLSSPSPIILIANDLSLGDSGCLGNNVALIKTPSIQVIVQAGWRLISQALLPSRL
ncbi:MAG: hypothetical protein ABI430_04230 [Candidatus Taylorbacteria bacterium]